MRAGGFAEKRVIDLINRRFVPYYFNTGQYKFLSKYGCNSDAEEFVRGKTANRLAFLAAFSSDGQLLGQTRLYADKNEIFDFLRSLLDDNPLYDHMAIGESKVLDQAQRSKSAGDRLRAALLNEQLGRYQAAAPTYQELIDEAPNVTNSKSDVLVESFLGLLRITRFRKNWALHSQLEQQCRSFLEGKNDKTFDIDLDLERAYRLLAENKYAAVRRLLQPLASNALHSPRLAEIHFYAGVACWFLHDKAWAKFHWAWVIENAPEDRFYQRSYLAAGAEEFPYENPELGGYCSSQQGASHGRTRTAIQSSLVEYKRLMPLFQKADYGGAPSTADVE